MGNWRSRAKQNWTKLHLARHPKKELRQNVGKWNNALIDNATSGRLVLRPGVLTDGN
jgi:hypothetical protein